jgi:predicted transcriptional regulator
VNRKLVATFKPHSKGLAKLFGSLEADIMDLIWNRGHASAREVFEDLRTQGQRLSYGAVKTVLDRLVVKQILVRSMTGNQYVYHPLASRDEYTRQAVGEIVGSLFASFRESAYAQFVSYLEAEDPERIAYLSELLDRAVLRQGMRERELSR